MNIKDILSDFHSMEYIGPSEFPEATLMGGYWAHGTTVYEVSGSHHIQFIVEHPDLFNLTIDEIKSIFNKNGEEFQTAATREGKAREEIIKLVAQDGWIRVRHYIKPRDYWSIQCDRVKLRKENLRDFVNWALDKKVMGYHDEAIILGYEDDYRDLYDFQSGGIQNFLMEESKVKESSYSTIIKHIENGTMFSVVSGCRGINKINGWNLDEGKSDISKEDALKLDLEAGEKLKLYLKGEGYGYIEQAAVYDNAPEFSYFILGMPLDESIELGKKFNQKSIIHKNTKVFAIFYTKDFVDGNKEYHIGDKGMSFKQHVAKNALGNSVITFNPEVLQYANSQLLHANKNQRKPFAFIAEHKIKWYEYHILERWNGLQAYKEGRPTKYWVRIR